MRYVYAFLLPALLAGSVRAELIYPAARSTGNAGAMSSVLLARIGSIPAFSMGSPSATQRDLAAEGTTPQTQSNMIYYSSMQLALLTPSDPGNPLGGYTSPGDNGVLTGGGNGGSAAGAGAPQPVAVPAPPAAVLGLLGLLSLPSRKRPVARTRR